MTDCIPGQPVAGCEHREPHTHGTPGAYRKHGCREAACATARARYVKRLRHTAATKGPLTVPADRAREHVLLLIDSGLTAPQIARRAGVDRAAVRFIATGTAGKIRRWTETRLLAVTPHPFGSEATGLVDAIGTARRLQALAALGWDRATMADRIGAQRKTIRLIMDGRTTQVSVPTRAKVASLYDELWDHLPQPKTVGGRVALTRTINEAKANRWPVPMAWDDDQIDNPKAKPHRGPRTYEAATSRHRIRVEDIEFLYDAGVSVDAMVERLEIADRDSIRRALDLAGRLDLWQKLNDADRNRGALPTGQIHARRAA